jgi:tetratricopeptide (TPR) repeat protein
MAKDPADRWESAGAMVSALDRAMGAARPATEPTRPLAAPPPPPPEPRPPAYTRSGDGRGSGPWLLAGLAALILLAVAGFILISGGDNGTSPTAEREPTATATAERTPESTPEATPEATEEPTAEPTAEPTQEPEPTAEPPSGETDLERAADLQVQGFNARQAGNYEQALALSQQALDACGDAKQLSPCGYALFEVGAALNALGRPDEAIPYLEQRLEQYGDNDEGEVKRELKAARKAARD